MKYKYIFNIDEDGLIHITDLPFKTRYVEVPREERFRKLYSYVLIRIDLITAMKYLEVATTTTDPIIREGLFRIAVVLYAKCYSPAKHGGRSNIVEGKVYKDVQGEPIACHNKIRDMRSKYIAHDEDDFLDAQLGAVLDLDAKRLCGVAYIEKQAKFDYDNTIHILYTLCKISLEKVEAELDAETASIDEYLRKRDFDTINSYPDMKIKYDTI